MKKDGLETASKEQERDALNKISGIIESLGQDSYVGTAFDGCLEIAELNIRDDALDSLKHRLEKAEKDLENMRDQDAKNREKMEALQRKIQYLEMRLEREEEWEDYNPEDVSEEEYLTLFNEPGVEVLDDEKAKKLINGWLGFATERVEIIWEASIYQKNRHGRLREIGKVPRPPLYYATDMNYIRFACSGIKYEMFNGELGFAT